MARAECSVASVLGSRISDGGVDHVSIINGGSGFLNLIARVAGSAVALASRSMTITSPKRAIDESKSVYQL